LIEHNWSLLPHLPEYHQLLEFSNQSSSHLARLYSHSFPSRTLPGFELLASLLEYDPNKRCTAETSLEHLYFKEKPFPSPNALISLDSEKRIHYPNRKISKEEPNLSKV
jgi:cyclin-dependent kinase 8/11